MITNVELLSSNGSQIKAHEFLRNGLLKIDLVTEKSGIYFLRIMSTKEVKIMKIIKK